LVAAADAEGIPYTIEATPGRTGTDAENVFAIRSGVATGLVSVPLRYMHSPNEVVQFSDIVHAARLLAAFCRRLTAATELRPV
jgi:endoglucanase